jgi:two-component system sensor histidine kinase/response regulator
MSDTSATFSQDSDAAPHGAVPILLVDDDESKRLALKSVLAPLGYHVVEADSGTAALRCLMANDFAVILLDVRMPIMDGFETAALIRLRRQSEMTPIIFITANQAGEIGPDRYAQGAVDFITAPIDVDELRAKVSVFARLFIQAEVVAARAREVQRSADQLRLLTETAPIGIFQTDAENRYVYTNARWTEITGIPSATAVGQQWHAIIDDDQRDKIVAEFEESPDRSEFAARLERRVPGPSTRIMLLTSKMMLADDGRPTGRVGTLADITAEAGAEAALAEARDQADMASSLKSDFLANMSHEIRTPMTGVIGLTELLLETELDEHQREFAQTLSKSGQALLTVINGILDFSKIETGKLEVEDIELSVQTIVDEVVDLLAPSARSKGLELMAVLDRSAPAVVRGDPIRLRQVLTNLTGNAIKFTHAGEVVIRVTAVRGAGSETVLRFELTDTGVGIAPDKLAMIFEPFTQADTSTTREYGGTGLGLAISRELVTLMHGEVGTSSELGTGSTFWFTVLVQALADEGAVERWAPDSDLAGVRILVVDDNDSQRSILAEYLTRWGMSVDTAVSAQTAWKALHVAAEEGRPVAVALVDQSMHRLNGVNLATAIHTDPVLTTRLVLMTEDDSVDLAELEACASLSKPIHREDLRASIRRALDVLQPTVGERPDRLPAPRVESTVGRLLVAEDNLINQMVAVAILSKAGYLVDTARNGSEAVRAAASQEYDAILMDCHMPQMNGYEATAAIRQQEAAGHHTPIIALTAGARGEDRERCLLEGMDEYLSKPVHKAPLLDMVRQSIRSGGATERVPR